MKYTYPAIIAVLLILLGLPAKLACARQPQPTPTVDRLAIPTLPANPTQIDLGRSLYYYHCMPCHGDYGQGLTDEFRGIWEDDHQNCWGRGCHGGRPRDEGFPIPTVVPAVNDPARLAQAFPAAEDLRAYLSSTHPPQNPGVLKDEEYRALTAYVFSLAGSGAPADESAAGRATLAPALAGGGLLLLLLLAAGLLHSFGNPTEETP